MMEMIKSMIVLSRGALSFSLGFLVILILWLSVWFTEFLSHVISLFV
jgi:hypothetical protein